MDSEQNQDPKQNTERDRDRERDEFKSLCLQGPLKQWLAA